MLTQTDTFTKLPPAHGARTLTFALAGVGAKLQSVSVNGVSAQMMRETLKDETWLHLVRVALPTGKTAVVESVWMTTAGDDNPQVAVTIVDYDTTVETKH